MDAGPDENPDPVNVNLFSQSVHFSAVLWCCSGIFLLTQMRRLEAGSQGVKTFACSTGFSSEIVDKKARLEGRQA